MKPIALKCAACIGIRAHTVRSGHDAAGDVRAVVVCAVCELATPLPIEVMPRGLFCPECGSTDLTPIARALPLPGSRFRYLRCKACECRMKTEEMVIAVTRSGRFRESSVTMSSREIDETPSCD